MDKQRFSLDKNYQYGGIERRIERDHGLPKGPVSLRNPTVGAEIARLPHLTLACKPFFMGIASKRARDHHGSTHRQ